MIDGDSIEFIAKVKGHGYARLKARIDGIDTPEMKGNTELEKQAARRVTAVVKTLIEGKLLKIQLLKKREKFGRALIRVDVPKHGDLSEYLIRQGLALAYNGRKKTPFTKTFLEQIGQSEYP